MPGAYGSGSRWPLPEGPHKEVDVEGMERAGAYLWVVGCSHTSRTG